MRVITGTARGRKLKTPMGEQIRPTSERVKEAVFSMLHYELPGCVFADLFSGTGQMGIEAVSRGATRCVFVDSSRDGYALTKENVTTCGFLTGSQVICSDVADYLRHSREKFDIAFLDPPYGKGLVEHVLPLLADLMQPDGKILLETGQKEDVPTQAGDFVLTRTMRYGIVKISVYQQPAQEEGEV